MGTGSLSLEGHFGIGRRIGVDRAVTTSSGDNFSGRADFGWGINLGRGPWWWSAWMRKSNL
jgi:hypothetical protein